MTSRVNHDCLDSDHCRCPWLNLSSPLYVQYHDEEWGVPLYDDQKIFEFLSLESAQAGLSWLTILNKRDNYRQAFDQFNPALVARYDESRQAELLLNAGIVRHKGKIAAAINNARCFLAVQEEFGSFADYMWRFVDGEPKVLSVTALSDYPTQSPESEALCKDLKQRGFKFLGPTTCYAHMEATGMVNAHSLDCFRRDQIIAGY